MKSSSSEDMDLYSGAIESRIGRGGRAVKDQHWQICEKHIVGVVKVDFVLRQNPVACDSNHCETVEIA